MPDAQHNSVHCWLGHHNQHKKNTQPMAKTTFRSATVAELAAVRSAAIALMGDVGQLFPASAVVRLNGGTYHMQDGAGSIEAKGLLLEIKPAPAGRFSVVVEGANYLAVVLIAHLLGARAPRKVQPAQTTQTAQQQPVTSKTLLQP